jgi:hypothetical protein
VSHGSCWASGSLSVVLSLNLGESPSVRFPAARRSDSLGLALASGGSAVKVRQITFRTGYFKFCFDYTGRSYLSLSRLRNYFFYLLPSYILFSFFC